MPELQKSSGGRVEQSGAYRFAKAWELAMSRREGIETGLQKGRQEGLQEGLQTGLRKGILKGRQEGVQRGRKYGKIQALESLLGLPETPVEVLSTLSLEEIERRLDELTRRVRGRIS